MESKIVTGIRYTGLSKETCLNRKYKADFQFFEKFDLEENTQVLSVAADVTILNFEIINSKNGRNITGEVFQGKNIIVQLSSKAKVKYIVEDSRKVFVCEWIFNTFANIEIPEFLYGEKITDLNRKKNIEIKSSVEDIIIQKNSNKTYGTFIRGIIWVENDKI
ncbi:MAG: hypothetical protein ACRC6T_09160 [Sarcina sp.]